MINSTEELRIRAILDALLAGKIILTSSDIALINSISTTFIKTDTNDLSLETVKNILIISNILYNNSELEVLPLEDGVYDLMVAKYNALTNGNAPVGAPSTPNLHVVNEFSELEKTSTKDLVEAVTMIDNSNMRFYKNIHCNQNPILDSDFDINTDISAMGSKLTRDVAPSYPELIGTLHKCKFVTVRDALNSRVELDDPSIMIFERDFLYPTFPMAAQYGPVEMIAELKYDGVSVEAEIENDTIVSANSRGDTQSQKATDFTSIFGGKKFPRAKGLQFPRPFGMKFEAIITYRNLYRLEKMFGISYKNPRVAVSGILSNVNASKYRDFITLVPIKSSGLQFNSVKEEIDFLNKYYSSGVEMRYAIIYGNYAQLLAQTSTFVQEAEYMRSVMPFMYDGVVLSYTNPNVIYALGRKNSIDNYSMAIKFNAKAKNTHFLKYTFSVGQDGRITPIAHYHPVEFFGTIHNKTTVHSYKRFFDLDLREGSIVSIKYVNDVIPYLTKPDISFNRKLDNEKPAVPFPEVCPSCGQELSFSNSGDSVWCLNFYCPEKVIGRVTNMMKKLNIKDFGAAYLERVNVRSLSDLLHLKKEDVCKELGDVLGNKLMDRINSIKTEPIYDYQIVGSIGFSGMSISRWKEVLQRIPLEDIITDTPNNVQAAMENIKGFGSILAENVTVERPYLLNDLMLIRDMPNVIRTYGNIQSKRPQVRFSGVRDINLEHWLNSIGYDADGTKGVTKNTKVLIVPNLGFNSTKVAKAKSINGCYILTPTEAYEKATSILKTM